MAPARVAPPASPPPEIHAALAAEPPTTLPDGRVEFRVRVDRWGGPGTDTFRLHADPPLDFRFEPAEIVLEGDAHAYATARVTPLGRAVDVTLTADSGNASAQRALLLDARAPTRPDPDPVEATETTEPVVLQEEPAPEPSQPLVEETETQPTPPAGETAPARAPGVVTVAAVAASVGAAVTAAAFAAQRLWALSSEDRVEDIHAAVLREPGVSLGELKRRHPTAAVPALRALERRGLVRARREEGGVRFWPRNP